MSNIFGKMVEAIKNIAVKKEQADTDEQIQSMIDNEIKEMGKQER